MVYLRSINGTAFHLLKTLSSMPTSVQNFSGSSAQRLLTGKCIAFVNGILVTMMRYHERCGISRGIVVSYGKPKETALVAT